jgi:hypothetical protein
VASIQQKNSKFNIIFQNSWTCNLIIHLRLEKLSEEGRSKWLWERETRTRDRESGALTEGRTKTKWIFAIATVVRQLLKVWPRGILHEQATKSFEMSWIFLEIFRCIPATLMLSRNCSLSWHIIAMRTREWNQFFLNGANLNFDDIYCSFSSGHFETML